MRKALAALSLAGAFAVAGCGGDIEVHDHYYHRDYYEDRPIHRVRVEEEVPPPPPVAEAPPPPQADTSVDTGDATADEDVDTGEDVQYFHDDLQPYGDWVVTADFGRCFRPHAVAVGWRPYTLGHWVYTDDHGWLWASDESFGWATYHYGRWSEDPRYGWVWIPGRVWAPAWVAWRHGTGVCGWAPLPPRRHGGVEVSIDVAIGHIRPDAYCFVDVGHLAEPHVRDHFRPVQQNVTIINQTTNITNITNVHGNVINKSVNVTEVEHASGRRVTHERVVDTQQKGPSKESGNTVQVFRPNLPAPKKKAVAPVEAEHVTAKNTSPKNTAPKNTTPSHSPQVESIQSKNSAADSGSHQKPAKSTGKETPPPPPPSANVDTESDKSGPPKHRAKAPADTPDNSSSANDPKSSGSGKGGKPRAPVTDNNDSHDSHASSGKGGKSDQPPPPPQSQGKSDKNKKKTPNDGGDQVQ
ncbi:MAG TPA: DUF6600 domain-containing protein [Tepidisphaeraceae bacterium]|jgi:hypothetical protein|nr:DUF6600 domain-containing protein [Tepidisphaeraceae bacterium]